MASTKLIISIAILVTIFISSGQALQCYECQGEPDGDCAKGVVSAMEVVECPGGALAMCNHIDSRNGSGRRFTRGCTKYANPDFCTLMWRLSAQNPMALKVFSCESCWEPKCNVGVTRK